MYPLPQSLQSVKNTSYSHWQQSCSRQDGLKWDSSRVQRALHQLARTSPVFSRYLTFFPSTTLHSPAT